MVKSRLFFLLILQLLITSSPVASEAIFHEEDTVIMDNGNWINWGVKTVFDADHITEYEKTLEIGNRNITLYSSDSTNFTVYNYDLSGPGEGQNMLKLGSASSSSTKEFGFNGVPDIDYGRYRLYRDNSQYKDFGEGGEISWSSDGGSSNFSLAYENVSGSPDVSLVLSDTEIVNGSSVKISCSASSESSIESTSLTVEKPEGDLSNHNCGSKFSETEAVGKYHVNFTASDSFGNTNSLVKSFETEKPESEKDNETASDDKTETQNNESKTNNSDEKVSSKANNNQVNDDQQEQSSGGGGTGIQDSNEKTRTQGNSSSETGDKRDNQELSRSERRDKESEEDPQERPGESVTEEEALEMIRKAEKLVDEDSSGYEKIEEARESLEAGNYSEAERLASNIIESRDSSVGSSSLVLYGGILLLILVISLSLYHFYPLIRHKMLERKLEKVYDEVEEKARKGDLRNSERIYRKLEEANNAFGNDNYEDLSRVLDDIDRMK